MGNNADVNLKLQDPDDDIKPRLSAQQVPELVRRLYGLEETDSRAFQTSSKYLKCIRAKINKFKLISLPNAQHALCQHVYDRGISTQRPWRLSLTYVPGTIFYETPYVAGYFYNAGVFVARLHNAIMDVSIL
ncbi:hypothetical protein DPMN_135689 [Dreissena polymorpha]|uniref:Uncharacterized protein n=1 Tax=Dreissena polymorpha TaxID=45954 RepID=A0A9D4JBY3_DREPO|nr:hypothetical protein DPMN_135689 [Dreissena polymorpha]